MKRALYIFLALSCGIATRLSAQTDSTLAGWHLVNSGTDRYVGRLCVPNGGSQRDTIYAQGADMLRTVDGGLNWAVYQNTPRGGCLWWSPSFGYRIRNDSVSVTYDAGEHWTAAFNGMFRIDGACFASEDTAFVVGQHEISRTTDRGQSWHYKAINAVGLNAVAFGSSKVGIAVGDEQRGPIIEQEGAGCFVTTDGGESWTQKWMPTPNRGGGFISPRDMHAVDENTYVAVGGVGSIYRTSDKGEHWVRIDSGLTWNHLSRVDGRSNTLMATGEHGTVMRSTDSGLHWNVQTFDLGVDTEGYEILGFNDVAVIDDTTALICADHGLIFRTTNGGQAWVQDHSSPTYPLRAYPNPCALGTSLAYALPDPSEVSLMVYDALGREITRATGPYGSPTVTSVNTINLAPGVYHVSIANASSATVGSFTVAR